MSAPRTRFLTFALVASCASTPSAQSAPEPASESATSAPASGGQRPSCPRIERAQRMWTGFLVDVPSEAMVRALDVVVPIQEALGELFCAETLRDCRPASLLSIDLSDASASEAQLRLKLAPADAPRELPLTLRAHDASWQAEPNSLAEYLSRCRNPAAEPGARATK